MQVVCLSLVQAHRIFNAYAALEDGHMKSPEWETSRIHELDLASTELSSECLMDILSRMPGFSYLGLAHCEFFTDKVSIRAGTFD